MHELPWITIFGSRVRRFANNFHELRSHEWKSLIASRVTQKSLLTVKNVLFYFLHAIWCPEHSIPPKQLSIADFAAVAKDSLFWFSIVTSRQLLCDVTRMWDTSVVTVIFVDCSCTRKLAQRRSSLVNNSREYRYLITRYSRPSV